MKKILALLIIAPMLISCSGSKKNQFNEAYVKDTNGFDILMGQFAHNIENIWGINEVLIAGPKDYVKYSDQYYTRSHINFDAGTITLETISGTDPAASLRKAIISTLLVGDDPGNVDLYSDVNDIQISREPMLYGQVLDNTGQPIRMHTRPIKFFKDTVCSPSLPLMTRQKTFMCHFHHCVLEMFGDHKPCLHTADEECSTRRPQYLPIL